MDDTNVDGDDFVAQAKSARNRAELVDLLERIPTSVESATAFLAIGHAAKAMKENELAFSAYEKAQAFDLVISFYSAAEVATRMKRESDALRNIEAYLSRAKQNAAFFRYVGRCLKLLAHLSRFDVADDVFSRFDGEHIDVFEFYLSKAYVEQARNNHVAARLYARKAINLAPENLDLKMEVISEFSPPEDFVEFDYDGKHFTFFYHELLDPERRKRTSQFVELNMLEYIRDELGPQRTVLDIGCHIGNHSRYIKEFVPHDSVIGFDAAPNAAQFYCRNVPNPVFYGYALGIEGETVSLLGDILNHRWGQSRIALGDESLRSDARLIQTRSLDSFSFQNVSLIKIDVESWELKVIEGGLDTINQWRPKIILEVWNENTERYYQALNELLPDYEQLHEFIDTDNPKKKDILISPRN